MGEHFMAHDLIKSLCAREERKGSSMEEERKEAASNARTVFPFSLFLQILFSFFHFSLPPVPP